MSPIGEQHRGSEVGWGGVDCACHPDATAQVLGLLLGFGLPPALLPIGEWTKGEGPSSVGPAPSPSQGSVQTAPITESALLPPHPILEKELPPIPNTLNRQRQEPEDLHCSSQPQLLQAMELQVPTALCSDLSQDPTPFPELGLIPSIQPAQYSLLLMHQSPTSLLELGWNPGVL